MYMFETGPPQVFRGHWGESVISLSSLSCTERKGEFWRSAFKTLTSNITEWMLSLWVRFWVQYSLLLQYGILEKLVTLIPPPPQPDPQLNHTCYEYIQIIQWQLKLCWHFCLVMTSGMSKTSNHWTSFISRKRPLKATKLAQFVKIQKKLFAY